MSLIVLSVTKARLRLVGHVKSLRLSSRSNCFTCGFTVLLLFDFLFFDEAIQFRGRSGKPSARGEVNLRLLLVMCVEFRLDGFTVWYSYALILKV